MTPRPVGREYCADDEGLYTGLRRSLVQLRLNALVVADPEVGTAVADETASRLHDEPQSVRRVDASSVGSAFDLLRAAGRPDSADVPGDDWLGLVLKLAATSHRHDHPRFVIVDRIPSADMGFTLFGRMRDDLWEIHYRWAVVIRPDELPRYTTHPADTFFQTNIRVKGD